MPDELPLAKHRIMRFVTRYGLRRSLSGNRHNVLLGSGLLGQQLHVPDELPVGEHGFMWFVTRVSLWCPVSGHGHDVLLWPNLHWRKLQGGRNLQWRG